MLLLKDRLLEFLTQPFSLIPLISLVLMLLPTLSLPNLCIPDFRKDLRWLREVKKIKGKLFFIFVLYLLVRGHSGKIVLSHVVTENLVLQMAVWVPLVILRFLPAPYIDGREPEADSLHGFSICMTL